jgi:hypothetical protein
MDGFLYRATENEFGKRLVVPLWCRRPRLLAHCRVSQAGETPAPQRLIVTIREKIRNVIFADRV